MNSLLELNYWPPVSWLSLAGHSAVLQLEACENYQKGSYRNRCHLAGPNGLQRLSIPLLKGKHQQTPIRDVRIATGEAWQQVHWRSIATAYGNAPYFEHYEADIQAFYQKSYTFLFDLNLDILHFCLKQIGWEGEIRFTTSYVPAGQIGNTDFRDAVSPKATTLPYWFHPEPYPQVFMERHGFLPDLAALDLLFCCGRQASEIIQKSLRNPDLT